MRVLYSDEPFDYTIRNGIFLAGPTPRREDVISWRPKALKIIQDLGFKGSVFVPEYQNGGVKGDYIDQVEWEESALNHACAIAFWVPRNMKTMPALTTNVEFGFWMAKRPEKVLYGRPTDSEKNRYLDWLYSRHHFGAQPYTTLEGLLNSAVYKAENVR